jgi:hypothetical protein
MNYDNQSNLNKNHGFRRDFRLIARSNLLNRLHDCTNTTGTQNFTNLSTAFENRDFLQIRSKFSIGRSQRKTAIMTKCRCFSTFIAFRHGMDPFNYECLYFAGCRTSQQGRILPYLVTFYKNSVL